MPRKLVLMSIAFILLALVLTPSAVSSEAKGCSLCVGVVATDGSMPAGPVPTLIMSSPSDEESLRNLGERLSRLTDAQRRAVTIILDFSTAADETVEGIDRRIESIAQWASRSGPVSAFGIVVVDEPTELDAYALKRLSVRVLGSRAAAKVVIFARSLGAISRLHQLGAGPYVDAIVVSPDLVAEAVQWVALNDPVKRIWSRLSPSSPNPLFDAAAVISQGAELAFLETADSGDIAAIANWNSEVTGDFTPDSNPGILLLDPNGHEIRSDTLAFVRGEDLRLVVVPRGDESSTTIVSLPGSDHESPRYVGPGGGRNVTDKGVANGRYLIGVPPAKTAFLLTVDRPAIVDPAITKETIEVVGERRIPVEEIVRNHQAYWSNQEISMPRYIAHNSTSLRFGVGSTGETIEATLSGDHYFDRNGLSDWVWEDFYVNGVRWKYGRIPEIPIVQPEKVTQLPLDIHLTKDYTYELVDRGTRRGFDVFEVTFRPPADVPENLPLYRGTVWIDAHSWARVAISMIQLNLQGEVLSNEEHVEFVPYDRVSRRFIEAEDAGRTLPSSILWLPIEVQAQQVLSTAGRATPVIRETEFTDFRIDPESFDELYESVSRSRVRMVRDTESGLRYLEPTDEGKRVVKEGFDTARLFLLGGLHHDDGLEYGVLPLGGVNYFNFDLWGKGLQTNVFFAGVIVAANLTQPSLLGTRANAGADAFALAIPFENTTYRNGEEVEAEAVEASPANVAFRVGHPVLGFGKIDLSLSVSYVGFGAADTTADDFAVPADTFILAPALSFEYNRRGYALQGFYEYADRTDWEPWGIPSEFDPEQKDFEKYGLSLAKTFYLPRFQRLGIGLNYLDGNDLDRFSKYELGFFGAQRVRGIRSGSVRAESAWIGHLSYGLVAGDLIRLEAFYDMALLDDRLSGLDGEQYQGVGIGGQMVGPWGTILRLDVGKSVGDNRQDGFVANVVFLKLFD